jgi:hypothetical protein
VKKTTILRILTAAILACVLLIPGGANSTQLPGWGPVPPSYTILAVSPTIFPESAPGVRAFGIDHAFVSGYLVYTPPQAMRFCQGIRVVDVPIVSATPVGPFGCWDVSSSVGVGYGFQAGAAQVRVFNTVTGLWSAPIFVCLP